MDGRSNGWRRTLTNISALSMLLFAPAVARADQIADGTTVPVRLLDIITSERSTSGQRLGFVVTKDVIVDGKVMIERGTPVIGEIVDARRARWDFTHKHARLAFKFVRTTGRSGEPILLRASPARGKDDRVNVSQHDRHHELLWATEAATFNAYVDGNYNW